MTTKYLVKQVGQQDGKNTYTLKGTALLFDDGERGVIKTNDWGDLQLLQKEKPSANGHTVYTVKKAKPGKEEGKTIANEVGTFVLRPDGTTAVLFLHLLNGSFPAFLK